MGTIQQATVDFEKRCDDAAAEFYRAGVRYIRALDQLIEAEERSLPPDQLRSLRQRVRITENYLHRLFPDEFADTSSAEE